MNVHVYKHVLFFFIRSYLIIYSILYTYDKSVQTELIRRDCMNISSWWRCRQIGGRQIVRERSVANSGRPKMNGFDIKSSAIAFKLFKVPVPSIRILIPYSLRFFNLALRLAGQLLK